MHTGDPSVRRSPRFLCPALGDQWRRGRPALCELPRRRRLGAAWSAFSDAEKHKSLAEIPRLLSKYHCIYEKTPFNVDEKPRCVAPRGCGLSVRSGPRSHPSCPATKPQTDTAVGVRRTCAQRRGRLLCPDCARICACVRAPGWFP